MTLSLPDCCGISGAVEFFRSESFFMIQKISKVGVIGLGVMGFDIAFLYAMRGCQTSVYDAAKGAMDSLPGRSEQTIERLKRRNRISDGEIEYVKSGLIRAAQLEQLAKKDIVTEVVSENKSGSTQGWLRRHSYNQYVFFGARDFARRRSLRPRQVRARALFQPGALYTDGRGGERGYGADALRYCDCVP